jgi:5,10-methylenetetrahydromethanopterin reductase
LSPLPTIGVRVHGGMPPKACIEIAEACERNEFAALWFAENPFNRGILPAAAGAVLATRRIKIGIGVFNPYNRHPTLIAMELGALDEMADGRIALGIGSGIGDRVTRMGLSYEKPLAAVRDAITIVRGMMKGESVTYNGNVFSVTNVKLEFPVPRPNMPIYMAATGDQSLRVCGQVADGLMISNMSPPGYTIRALQLVAEGAVKAGRPMPTTVIQYVPCVIRPDRTEARQIVKATLGDMLSAYWAMGEKWPAIRVAMLRGSGIPEEEFVAAVNRIKAGENPTFVLDDRFVDAYSIAGNVDDCLAAMRHFGEIGVTELVVTFVGGQPLVGMANLSSGLKGVA